jgi:hypothetical protein
VLQRLVGDTIQLERCLEPRRERLRLQVVEGVHVLGSQVQGALRQLGCTGDHHLHLLAVVHEVVVVLHLAAVRLERIGVVAEGAAAAALQHLLAPLQGPALLLRLRRARQGQGLGFEVGH